jgi:ABC-type enterochelin transport system permease subunit
MVTIAPGQVLAILAHQLHPELPWTFTLGADLVARTLVAPAALPLGIVTAMLGASFFLYLLLRHRGQWGL